MVACGRFVADSGGRETPDAFAGTGFDPRRLLGLDLLLQRR
jgi:hypothetical protein